MIRAVAILLGMLLSFSCYARGPGAVRKTVEASMQVTGKVVIAPDGALRSYVLDNPEALPAEVRSLLELYLPACEFSVTTASGKQEEVTAKMSLQVLARQNGKGGSILTVNDSNFMDPDTPDPISVVDMSPPQYPMTALRLRLGLSGTVYVVLRLNPDGSVAEAHAEQVNMTVIGSESALASGRSILAKAALTKARQWRFTVSAAALAEGGPIDVRVPVDFKFEPKPLKNQSEYGKWQAYVPGPRAPIPWRPEAIASEGLGAMSAGGLYPLDSKIKLRSPPTGI